MKEFPKTLLVQRDNCEPEILIASESVNDLNEGDGDAVAVYELREVKRLTVTRVLVD